MLEDNLYTSEGPKKTAVSYEIRHFITIITASTNVRTMKSGLWKITYEDLGADRIQTLVLSRNTLKTTEQRGQ
jgi:hypothetical protein